MTEMVSIIVPFYNGKAYMEQCVHSVLEQTYPHFELLLIDDGSQDGGTETAREICRRDQRFRFIQLPHGGVSAARNAGIEAAKGTYLFFLDIDDTIHPRLLEALVEVCGTTGAAFSSVLYNHVYVEETDPKDYPTNRKRKDYREWNYTYMEKEKAIRQFSTYGSNFQAIGGKMFRRDKVGSLRFDEKVINGEDTLFVYDFLNKGNDAVLLWEKWYDYWHHSNGASQQLRVQTLRDTYQCIMYIVAHEKEHGRTEGEQFWMRQLSFHLRKMYARSWKEHNQEVFAYIKTLARDFKRKKQYTMLSLRDRGKNFLAYHCFPLYLPLHTVAFWRWKRQERKLMESIRNEENLQENEPSSQGGNSGQRGKRHKGKDVLR